MDASRFAPHRSLADEPRWLSSEHAERVMGHGIPGVEGIYDRYAYRDEKANALARLAALIDGIVHPRHERHSIASQGPMTSQLPPSLIEAEAVAFARADPTGCATTPFPFSASLRGSSHGRRSAFCAAPRESSCPAIGPEMKETLHDYERSGWDQADEALRDAIIEFLDRGELLPTVPRELQLGVSHDGFRPRRAEEGRPSVRDIGLMVVVEIVMRILGLNRIAIPRRNVHDSLFHCRRSLRFERGSDRRRHPAKARTLAAAHRGRL